MNKKIVLNWLPPASTDMPSPAMTVLKGALQKAGFNCKILYWNILFEDIIRFYLRESSMDKISEVDYLGVFYAYIPIEKNDKDALLKQEIILKSLNPHYFSSSFDFKKHIRDAVSLLKNRIKEVLSSELQETPFMMGFSMNLFQWIPASILAKEIKILYPNCKIAIGGIGNPNLAKAFLQNFPHFDFALWGEGEISLVKLAFNLDNPAIVPHMAYRVKNNNIELSLQRIESYPSLNDCFNSDFDDYFNVYKGTRDKINLTIESSRGCHWNRCKFCFLNQGYRYRVKSPEDIISEIRFLISKYNVFNFSFLDNDVIGNDYSRFHNLLTLLSGLKQDYPNFKINLAEIITRGISKTEVKEMALAGFVYVQIGYESVSDNILVKINKKNSFASNLLFIKWAIEYDINVVGLNVLRGLLDETDADILESIDNLYFMRFYKSVGNIKHNVSMLAVNEMSRYYKEICSNGKTNEMYYDPIMERLPKGYVRHDDEFKIYQLVRKYQNPLWNNFVATDQFFDVHTFSYKLIVLSNNTIIYQERRDNIEVNTLSFERDGIHWKILMFCNEKVRSITEILEHFKATSETDIKDTITALYSQGLLYYSIFREECVSIINTNKII